MFMFLPYHLQNGIDARIEFARIDLSSIRLIDNKVSRTKSQKVQRAALIERV